MQLAWTFRIGTRRTSPCSGSSDSVSMSPDDTTMIPLWLFPASPNPNPGAFSCAAAAAVAKVVTGFSFVTLSPALSP